MNKEIFLQQLLPLNDTEQKLKQYHASHPGKRLMTDRELRPFMKKYITQDIPVETTIPADALIPQGHHVMAVRHLRYLPGCFHSHNFFEINCVLAGACTYQTPDKNIQISRGDVVIFPPGQSHSIEVYSDGCILINILIRSNTFDLYFFSIYNHYDFLAEFWTQALYGEHETPYLLFRCGAETQVGDCVLDLYREALSKNQYQGQMMDALLHVFMILLLRHHEQDLIIANPENLEDDRNLIKIMNYIEENYRTLTLEKLAEQFHYSERQMMRILKEYTGSKFGDLIRDIKLKKAAAFLEKSSLSIQAIVETAGYSDISHFYRVFKKRYGCTPIEYRASHQNLQ